VYTLFFVPVPNPGQLIGFRDEGVDLSQTAFQETTVAIFLLERVSYGFDSLGIDLLSWDVTASGQELLMTNGPPNNTERVFNFIALRGQFLKRYGENLWNNTDLVQKGIISEDQESSALGTWDLLDTLTTGQWDDYFTKQMSTLLYNLLSYIGVIISYILLMILALLVFMVAGVTKYVPIFMCAIFFFLLPFGWMMNGRKALGVLVQGVIVYLPLKTVLLVVIWISFFVIESTQIQGYQELAKSDAVITGQLKNLEPGWLYTVAGGDFLKSNEALGQSLAQIGITLISMLVALLAMVYVVFKTPSFTSAMLSKHGMADDMFSQVTMLATAFMTGGASLLDKLRPKSNPNAVKVKE